MKCPNCGHDPLPEGARYCPICSQDVRIAAGVQAQVRARIDVQQNAGQIIGVQAETIGTAYGEKIYQTQVYILGGARREVDWEGLLDKSKASPYRFLAPYTTLDKALFFGRKAQAAEVVRRVAGQPLLVVHGPTGIGKTSLLLAGALPEWMSLGALAVRVQDYVVPVEESILQALGESAPPLAARVSAEASLPELIESIARAARGTFVLVLDQFERAFEPAAGESACEALLRDIAQALDATGPDFLRVVLVVDALDRLSPFQERLPRLLERSYRLEALTYGEAQEAVEGPLAALGHPGGAGYVEGVLAEYLLPDLDALSPEAPGRIAPAHLQIVCRYLYREARARHLPPEPAYIDPACYRDLRGAVGIMHRYLDETLSGLDGKEALGRQVMEAMAFPGMARWIAPGDVAAMLRGPRAEAVGDALERLVELELVQRRAQDGGHLYGFANPIVADGVRLEAPERVKRRYEAKDDLDRVWAEWAAHEGMAKRAQLYYLGQAEAFLRPSTAHALLLLRSAVRQDADAGPWLKRLRAAGRDLIAHLELGQPLPAASGGDRAPIDEVRRLLGLIDGGLPPLPEGTAGRFGPLSWAAAAHKRWFVRQTAALALTAIDLDQALGRLKRAVQARGRGLRRWTRTAELWGTLWDQDPALAAEGGDLPPIDRVGIWLWRAGRRGLGSWQRILGLAAGGALGAGLGLGALRGLIAIPAHQLIGVRFALNFFWGSILGGATGLGIGLAPPLLLERWPREDAPPRQSRLSLAAAALGTAFFGGAHAVVAWLNGLSLADRGLMVPLGFLYGLGINLGLLGQPKAGLRQGLGRWLLRGAAAAALSVLAQLLVFLAGHEWAATAITKHGGAYLGYFGRYEPLRVIIERYPRGAACMDAAIVGLVLTVGMAAGFVAAARWSARWRDLVDRSLD